MAKNAAACSPSTRITPPMKLDKLKFACEYTGVGSGVASFARGRPREWQTERQNIVWGRDKYITSQSWCVGIWEVGIVGYPREQRIGSPEPLSPGVAVREAERTSAQIYGHVITWVNTSRPRWLLMLPLCNKCGFREFVWERERGREVTHQSILMSHWRQSSLECPHWPKHILCNYLWVADGAKLRKQESKKERMKETFLWIPIKLILHTLPSCICQFVAPLNQDINMPTWSIHWGFIVEQLVSDG